MICRLSLLRSDLLKMNSELNAEDSCHISWVPTPFASKKQGCGEAKLPTFPCFTLVAMLVEETSSTSCDCLVLANLIIVLQA